MRVIMPITKLIHHTLGSVLLAIIPSIGAQEDTELASTVIQGARRTITYNLFLDFLAAEINDRAAKASPSLSDPRRFDGQSSFRCVSQREDLFAHCSASGAG